MFFKAWPYMYGNYQKRIFGAWSNPKFTVSAILGEMPEKRVLRSLNVLIYSLEAYSPGGWPGIAGGVAVATCLVNFFFQCICTDPGGFGRSVFRIRSRVSWAIGEYKARSRWDLYEEDKNKLGYFRHWWLICGGVEQSLTPYSSIRLFKTKAGSRILGFWVRFNRKSYCSDFRL